MNRGSPVVALSGGVGGAKLALGLYRTLPPDTLIAYTCCTRLTGLRRSVSALAGAAPRTSTPATAPASTRIAVQPVGRSAIV